EARGRVGAGRIDRARQGYAEGAALVDRGRRDQGGCRRHVVDLDGGGVVSETAVLVEDAFRDGVVAGTIIEGEGLRCAGAGAGAGGGDASPRCAYTTLCGAEARGRVGAGRIDRARQRHADRVALVDRGRSNQDCRRRHVVDLDG